ncbi:hypothetical protein ACFLWC_02940 [Chloroflexota bacterium]
MSRMHLHEPSQCFHHSEKNIDQMADYKGKVTETYVREFHVVLDRLEDIGIDVSDFRIPDFVVKPMITASWSDWDGRGSQHRYSEDKYVDKSFILTKLDAILGYFEIITSEKPRKIGFTKD